MGPCAATGCWSRDTQAIGGVTLCQQHIQAIRAELNPPVTPASRYADLSSIVYYVTFDDGMTVKIGATGAPKRRFAELSARGRRGAASLLAARPGDEETETRIHRRFRHLRVAEIGQAKEFFRLDAEMREHLRTVHDRWPDWQEMADALDARNAPRPRRRRLAS